MREMIALIRACPDLADRVIIRSHNKTLEDAVTGSVYQALSSDAKKAHGLSPSFVVCDELAQWRGRELYDALVTGAGAHAESLMVVISTKSPDPNHVMSELVRHGQNIKEGIIEAPTFLPIIYVAPQDADPWDEKVWKACNPALGDFRSLEEMRDTAAMAKRIPAREPAFRLLYLNQPIDQAARFLNRVDWDACRSAIDIDALYGKRCILGLDLSATTDLTALTAYFPEGGETLPWFWMPEDKIDEAERRDNAPYRLWARQGNIETTPGKCIDKSFVMHRLGELVADFKVEACAYDRYQIAELNRLITDEGIKINMVEWGQGWKDGNAACVAIETAVLQRKLKHPGHPVLDWCVANAVTVSDPAGNRKLVKDRVQISAGGTPTWAAMLAFPATIQASNADVGSMAWVMNSNTVKKLRSTLKTSADTSSNFIMTEPNSLCGYPVAVTNSISEDTEGDSPSTEPNVFFGAWSQLLVAYWSGLDLLVNPYETSAYQKGRVLVRVMRDVDVAVRHRESFVFADDLETS